MSLNLTYLDDFDSIDKSSDIVAAFMSQPFMSAILMNNEEQNSALRRELALSLMNAAKQTFANAKDYPRLASILLAMRDFIRWKKAVRSKYGSMICETLSQLESKTSERLALKIVQLEKVSQISLLLAVLYFPVENLPEVAKVVCECLRKIIMGEVKKKQRGALEEMDITFLMYALNVCGKRMESGQDKELILNALKSVNGEKMYVDMAKVAIQTIESEDAKVPMSYLNFSPFSSSSVWNGTSDDLGLHCLISEGILDDMHSVCHAQLDAQRSSNSYVVVSPDSCAFRIQCNHLINIELKRINLLIKVTNVTSKNIANVRFVVHVPVGLRCLQPFSEGNQVHHMVKDCVSRKCYEFANSFSFDQIRSMKFGVEVALENVAVNAAASVLQRERKIECIPYKPSLRWTCVPLKLQSSEWSNLWNKLCCNFSENFVLRKALPPSWETPFHPCFSYSNESVIRMQLAALCLFEHVVLMRVNGYFKSSKWHLNYEIRAIDANVVWEIQKDGALASMFNLQVIASSKKQFSEALE